MICTLALKGLFLTFISGAMHSFSGMIVKQMKNVHPGQLSMYRLLGIFVISLPRIIQSNENLIGPKGFRLLLLFRGLFGTIAVFLTFWAFRYLPLGEATAITFCAPAFVTVFARIFLKETCSVFETVIVLVTIVGIMLVARIPLMLLGSTTVFTSEYVCGLLAALGGLFCNTVLFILLRKLKTVHSAVVLFIHSSVAVPVTAVLTALTGDFDLLFCGLQPILILVLAVTSYFSQLLLTIGMQYESAGPVATVRQASEMMFAFLWQSFFFHESSDEFSIAGAVLVSICMMLIGFRKSVLYMPSESKLLTYFRWMKV